VVCAWPWWSNSTFRVQMRMSSKLGPSFCLPFGLLLMSVRLSPRRSTQMMVSIAAGRTMEPRMPRSLSLPLWPMFMMWEPVAVRMRSTPRT
jgi:hypothetical protein